MNKTYLHITCLLVTLVLCLTASAQSVNLKTYYAAAVGKKKADLKAALHDIIGKASVLEYGSGSNKTWYGFYQTDRMSNNEVRDRYSNDHRYFSTSSPYNSVSGMNIEHSLANSWWGGTKNQAYKDIHHLMPCEAKINSSKSNYGMGKVTSVKTNNGCTKVGTGPGASGNDISMWEPADKWKGDFARVYFYMATAYESYKNEKGQERSPKNWKSDMITSDIYPFFTEWALKMLLRWSQQDPISEKEIKRNEAIYKIQKNRNPFVDYPGLEQYIWGSGTDIAFSYNNYTPIPTAIHTLHRLVTTDDDAIYTLQGQRVSGTTLKKGIYVRRGKKFVVK
jgi:endonuclease I